MLEKKTAQKVGTAIDKKIETAFDKGYKEATLRFATELEFWKIKFEKRKDYFFKGRILVAVLTTVVCLGVVVIFLHPKRYL